MKWSEIAGTIGKIAPVLGGALLGPAGVTVGNMLSGYLGVENTPDAIQQAMLDPGKAAEIVKFELEHKTELAQIALEHARLEIGDIQNARAVHKDSIVPALLSFILLAICASLLFCIIFVSVPESSEGILIQSFGTFLGFLGLALNFWYGTTRSSQNKDKLLGKQ